MTWGGTTLRVYENIQGHEFRYLKIFNSWEAPWMGMSIGDLEIVYLALKLYHLR